jgi:predicted MFS family arabinose efflux permease
VSLLGCAAGALLLAVDGPLLLSAAGAFGLGLSAGLPFAVIFAAAQRTRPDAPAAAIGLVNACAVLTVLIGAPLAGLAFERGGDGSLAFVAIAALAAAALLALRVARV